MANPVTHVGRDHGIYIAEEAALQDEERQIREDDTHFRQTGENRRPRRLDNPLVDNNYSPDIASDGDEYDNLDSGDRLLSEYVEDNPTELINTPSQNSRRQRNGLTSLQQSLLDGFQNIPSRQREVNAYNRREQEKEEKEFQEIKQKRIEQSKNAIMELDVDND